MTLAYLVEHLNGQGGAMYHTQPFSRRSALKALGAVGAAVTVPIAARAFEQGAPSGITDADIFNFALNLESLETEYYLRGTTGRGMHAADAGEQAGRVEGRRQGP